MYGIGDVIQEDTEEIAKLKKQVKALKAKNFRLEKKNKDLEAELRSYKSGCVPHFDPADDW
jgi:cell division protein FtsB